MSGTADGAYVWPPYCGAEWPTGITAIRPTTEQSVSKVVTCTKRVHDVSEKHRNEFTRREWDDPSAA